MPIKLIKPTGNARRQMSVSFDILDKKSPEKSLTFGSKNFSGRNVSGRITVRHRGGGSKKLIRFIDFKQTDKLGQKAKVIALEYDPNRTGNIALIQFEDGEKRYILAPVGLKKEATLVCDEKASIRIGNRMKLKNIPTSTAIYNVEIVADRGGQIARCAGSSVTLMGFDGDYAIIKLSSGEVRKVLSDNFASIGVVSNQDHNKVMVGKAGRVRLMGKRPHVRGKVMNPCDHPHGGGEGRNSIGMKYPKTPWGRPALGRKTRKKNLFSEKLIISKRKK